MLARWLSVIATYDFEVEHRKGVDHSIADGLSRLRCKSFNCSSSNKFSGVDKKDDGGQNKPEKVTQVNALTVVLAVPMLDRLIGCGYFGTRPTEMLAEWRFRYLRNATNENTQSIQTS